MAYENYRLSKVQVLFEHAYGGLKGHRRCQLGVNFPKLVAACCVLHNICEVNGDWSGLKELLDVNSSSTHNPAQPTANSVAITHAL